MCPDLCIEDVRELEEELKEAAASLAQLFQAAEIIPFLLDLVLIS
jgi:hypothetical protein